mmetsp:Transcript_32925/g.73961  ORF Transcript_32925/g.73961 Transcript_32925/m.73961 type:complete len:298 (-) Transcript_32925:87-980(-)
MVDGRFSPAMFTFGYQDHFAPQAQNNFSNVLSRLNDDLSDLCHKISSPHHHTPWGAMKSYDNDLLPHQAAHRLPSLPGAARQDAGAGDPGGQMNGISLLERKEWQEKNGHRDAGGSDKKFVPRPQVDNSYRFEKWMNTKVDHLMKDIGLIQNQLHTRRGQGQLIDDLRQRVEQLEARTKNSGPGRRQASFSNPLPQSTVDQDLPSFRERTGLKQGSKQGRGRKPILPTVEEGRAKKVRGDEKRFSKPTAEGGREGGKEARGLPSIRGAGKEDNPPSKHSARSRGQLSELGARRKMLR